MEKGKVQTVLGPIEPSHLGVTLCHEHLSMNFDVNFTPSPSPHYAQYEDAPLSLENLGWVKQNPMSSRSNIDLNDAQTAILEDVQSFKRNGGCTIVENSTLGLHRNMDVLVRVAKETGVNVIAGTGYYVAASLGASFAAMTEEDLVLEMTRDLIQGVDGSDVKCGVIGEIGCSWPLHDYEKKSLKATGLVQSELGCPVIIHPGRYPEAAAEIIRVLQEAGGDATKTIMSHLDRTLQTKDSLLEFATMGCYCEFDLFGMEASHYMLAPDIDMPSDAQRIKRIKWLVDAGYQDQITIAHDIHSKHRLTRYGGHGFSHILEYVMPKMIARGISKENVDKMVIDNPRRWLST